MNPDQPLTPREELEIKITALLMGQLGPEEAAQLEEQIAADPYLVTLRARLARAVELLRAARSMRDTPAPVQLSKEKREKLLAALRSSKPAIPAKPPVPQLKKKSRTKWIIPVILTGSIAAVLVGLLFPAMSGARSSARKRSVEAAKFESEHSLLRALPEASAAKEWAGAEAAPTTGGVPFAGLSDESKKRAMGWNSQSGVIQNFAETASVSTANTYAITTGTAPAPLPASAPVPSKPNSGGLPGVMRGRAGSGKSTADAGSIYLPSITTDGAAGPQPSQAPKSFALNLDVSGPASNERAREKQVEEVTKGLATQTESTGRNVTRGFATSDFANAPADIDRGISKHSAGSIAGRSISNAPDNSPSDTWAGGVRVLAGDVVRLKGKQEKDAAANALQPADGLAVGDHPVIAGNRSGSLAVNDNAIDALMFGRASVNEPVPHKMEALRELNAPAEVTANPEPAARPARPSGGAAVDDRGELTLNPIPANTFTGATTISGGKLIIKNGSGTLATQVNDPKGRETAQTNAGVTTDGSSLVPQLQEMRAIAGEEITAGVKRQNAAGDGEKQESLEMLSRDGTKDRVADADYDAARSQAHWEVGANWNRPYRRFDKQQPATTAAPKPTAGTALGMDDLAARSSTAQDGKDASLYFDTQLGDKNGRVEKGAVVFNGGGVASTTTPANVEFEGFINYGSTIAGQGGGPGGGGKPAASQPDGGVAKVPEDRFADTTARFGMIIDNAPRGEVVQSELKSNASSSALISTKESGQSTAQDEFVGAFMAVKKADEKKAGGEAEVAQEMYRGAADKLAAIKQKWPEWQPEVVEYRLKQTNEALQKAKEESTVAAKDKDEKTKITPPASEPPAPPKTPEPAPVPQPEVSTKENAFSTFSLNVTDVSFKLAAASLDKGQMPEPATVRSEEFINALDYRDPAPAPGAPFAFATERARYPFAHNRDLLRVSLKTAAAGRDSSHPLNLVLLVDNSGSMERADRVRILRESMRVLTKQFQPTDKLSVITFSRAPRLWADGVAGDKAAEATQRIGEITPEGGTDLSAAMDLGYATALKHYQPGSINRVVLLTDGAANLGEVKAETLKQKVEAHRKQGVAFDCFGVGWEGYNDDLLEQLSRNGDGRYGFINSPEAASTEFAGQLAGALRVAASDVKVQIEFNPRRVLAYRQVGYAKHQLKKEQFRDNTVDAAEIGAAESGNALYVIEVDPRGQGDIATARARYKVPGTSDYHEHEWTIPFQAPAPALEQSSSSLKLAATAAAFSEWLAQSPYAAEVNPGRLLGLINGIPAIYGADPRPRKLESMIQQAQSLR